MSSFLYRLTETLWGPDRMKRDLPEILNNWGDDGWELVTVVPGPSSEQLVAYMKRPKE